MSGPAISQSVSHATGRAASPAKLQAHHRLPRSLVTGTSPGEAPRAPGVNMEVELRFPRRDFHVQALSLALGWQFIHMPAIRQVGRVWGANYNIVT